MTLAYVFWHRPSPEALEYEAALQSFHRALGEAAIEGFRRSAAFRVQLPWCDGYEDWYLVDDWGALGVLNEHAPQLAEHGPVAAMSEHGAGGVYRLLLGEAALEASTVAWESKPPGMTYEAWRAQLTGRSVWQRQLVLGPGPEYCLPGQPGYERSVVA